MTSRQWTDVLSRATLAGLIAINLVACGAREPATDAERLARGRELVQQMSARLAAATARERDDHRRCATWCVASGAKEHVSLTGVYTVRRPDRFHAKMTGGRGLESWYDGKKLTVAVQQPTRSSRRRRCPRRSTARSTRWPSATTWRCRWAICSTAPPRRRCSPTRRPAATSAPRTSATRPATTWRFRTSAWTGSSGCRCRASRCRSG